MYIPKGVYKVSSIFLKSHMTLDIGEGAVISAYTEREKFPILPGLIESYDETDEYNLEHGREILWICSDLFLRVFMFQMW